MASVVKLRVGSPKGSKTLSDMRIIMNKKILFKITFCLTIMLKEKFN